MTPYRIEFDRRVKKDFKQISPQEVSRLKAAIAELSKDPRPPGCTKLKGEKRDYFRIRVGDYRVVYTVEDKVLLVLVVRVGHRQDVYDKL